MSDDYDAKAKVVCGGETVAGSQAPDVAATPQGVALRMRGRDGHPVAVSLSAGLLRLALEAWTAQVVEQAVERSSGVSIVGRDGAVTSYERLPPERQRTFARLVRGWQELKAAGHPNADDEGNASLARWLADDGSDESELARVNALRRGLGLPDAEGDD